MDKRFDLMNPDGFSHFNGPIFSFNLLLWVWHGVWPQGQWIFGPNLFLLIEKLNVAKDYIDFDSQFLEN